MLNRITGYEISYKTFPDGDFGKLERVEIASPQVGGNIDFWEKGWLEVHLYDYHQDKEIMHLMLEPTEQAEQESALEEMIVKLMYKRT